MIDNPWTRRQFMRIGAGAVAAGAAAKVTLLEPAALWASATQLQPSDTVRFASIGTGVRGCELLKASLRVPGVECVAVCDLWEGRLTAGQEAVKKTVATTRNYKEILDRKDVDAVIVAVTDHQHRRVVVDACAAGKDVYCEKPLSHTVDDGFAMIAAAQKYNRILQVGSQRVSSILYEKARQIYASGALGEVCNIDAYWDRNSASGAWVYPIPPGVNEQNLDWTAFLTGAPSIPFDPNRFFRWRCFTDYGEGLAGDLFVHLISGIQFITGTNMVASRAQSTGGLFRWKDGRQFPDLIETYYDYPNFRVAVRCNLNNDGGEFIGFYGTKGTLIIKNATLTFIAAEHASGNGRLLYRRLARGTAQAVRRAVGEGASSARAVRFEGDRRSRDLRSAAGIQRRRRPRGQLLQRGAQPQALRRERGLRQQRGHRLPSRELRVLQQENRDLGRRREEVFSN